LPLVFKDTQHRIKQVKVVLYGNNQGGTNSIHNTLTEVDAFVNKP
jgi:hypothetical protein